MSPRKKVEPRDFMVADIAAQFELASYWFGDKYCPAVHEKRDGRGFGIRVVKSVSISGSNRSYTYDYFEIDPDGTITSAPFGYTKDWKPGRVTDIAETALLYATPDPDARRFL